MINNSNEDTTVRANGYGITVSIGEHTFDDTTSNYMLYHEVQDFENSTFPIRTLTIDVKQEMGFKIMNHPVDKYGYVPVSLLVLPIDQDNPDRIINSPFKGGKFLGSIVNSDIPVPLIDVIDEDGGPVSESRRPLITRIKIKLFRSFEVGTFDNSDVNFFIPKSSSLINVLLMVLVKYIKYPVIISQLEHNPEVGKFMVTPRSAVDLVKMLDNEFGFFTTKYMMFVFEGILFLLNTDNAVGAYYKNLDFDITVSKVSPGSGAPKYMTKLSNGNYVINVLQHQAKVSKVQTDRMTPSVSYVFPNGNKITNTNLLARDVRTVDKLTLVEPLLKKMGTTREILDVTFDDVGFDRLNPLSKIFYSDVEFGVRVYRLSRVETTLLSGGNVAQKIKGFRIIEGGE